MMQTGRSRLFIAALGAGLAFAQPAAAQAGAAKSHLDAAKESAAAGRYVDALAAHARAIAAAPADVNARVQRAQLFGVLGHADLAALDYRAAVKLSPDDAGLQANLCQSLALANHDLDGALAACEAAVRIEPGNHAAFSARGYVHLRRGEYAAAEKDYAQALVLYPASPNEMFGYGIAAIHLGRVTEGSGEIASATLDNSGLPSEWQARGFGLKGEILPGRAVTTAGQASVKVEDAKVFLNADEAAASAVTCSRVVAKGAGGGPAGAWNGECRFGLAHGVGRMSAYGALIRLVYGREASGAQEETLVLAYEAVEDALVP